MNNLGPIKIIVNPRAGERNCSRLASQTVQNILLENRIEFNLQETFFKNEASEIASEALKQGFSVILVVGGDGTVSEVVNGIFKTSEEAAKNIAIGIIPTGTGNDFSYSLGISNFDPYRICKGFLKGYVSEIDVGIINQRYFINGVGLGLDAEIALQASKILHEKKNRYTYLSQVFKVFLAYRPKTVRIKIDDQPEIEKEIISLAIGNGIQFGRGFKLTPHARLDDELFDICLIEPIPKIMMFWNLPKVLRGKHTSLAATTISRGKIIRIKSHDYTPAHVDGEVIDEPEYNIRFAKEKLRVLIP